MNGRTNVVNNNSDSLGGIIPLEAPNNFVVVADNAKCLLTWTDPKDKYADELGEITDEGDQLVSQFAYTRIVRKTTGYPSGPNDGDIVTESSTRNQYQSTAYSDEGLVNNTLYYYAAFTCNTDGVWSGSVTGSATPKAYDPILANNTWEQINEVANEGIAASVWSIGDEIDIEVLNETVTACIIDFDHDTLSDGSGTAAITFGLKTIPNQKQPFWTKIDHNPSDVNYFNSVQWTWYRNTLIPSIPPNMTDFIKSVKKTAISLYRRRWYNGVSNKYEYDMATTKTVNCYLFPFSYKEVNLPDLGAEELNQYLETEGSLYQYYSTTANRVKLNNSGSPMIWNLRTCYEHPQNGGNYISEIYYITTEGTDDMEQIMASSGNIFGICFGFCIGKTPS